jgi:SOS-response transcriptional repressor LexA
MKALSERQGQLMHAIVTHWVERGFPPTLRELGLLVGVRSTNGITEHLRAMQRKGALAIEAAQSRSITLAPEYMRYVVQGWACKLGIELVEKKEQAA